MLVVYCRGSERERRGVRVRESVCVSFSLGCSHCSLIQSRILVSFLVILSHFYKTILACDNVIMT